MRIIKMENDGGRCEIDDCRTETQFMTDEDDGAASWICLNHIRQTRIPHGGH